jgi:anti-sigma factor RsiW
MNDGSPHELSAAYALDALDADELRAYEAHLAGCERCREDVASFRETASALARDIDVPPLPETLEHRILDAARAERSSVVPPSRRWAIPAATLAVASTAPSIVKAFNPNAVIVQNTSVMTITLTNPNIIPMTGVAFTDNFAALGLVITSAVPSGLK